MKKITLNLFELLQARMMKKVRIFRELDQQPTISGSFVELYGAGWGVTMNYVPVVPCHSLAEHCPFPDDGEHVEITDAEFDIKGTMRISKRQVRLNADDNRWYWYAELDEGYNIINVCASCGGYVSSDAMVVGDGYQVCEGCVAAIEQATSSKKTKNNI